MSGSIRLLQQRAYSYDRLSMGDITDLLVRARGEDSAAIDALFSELYPQLRRMAHARLAGGGRHTMLETTHWCTSVTSRSPMPGG